MLKILRFIFFLLISFFIFFMGILGGFNFRGLIAKIYDYYQLYLWRKEYEKKPWIVEAKKDFFGGKTPSKTWKLFLEDVKKGKIEEAANYFYISEDKYKEKNEILNYYKEKIKREREIILHFPEKILLRKPPIFKDYKMEAVSAFKIDGKLYSLDIEFEKNLWTDIWKINNYNYFDYSKSDEEFYDFYYNVYLKAIEAIDKDLNRITPVEEKEEGAKKWAEAHLKERPAREEFVKDIYRKIYNKEP